MLPPSVLDHHAEKVARVAAAVNGRPPNKLISIRKDTPAHQIHDRNWKNDCYRVDVSALNEVLGIVEGVDRSGESCMIAVCEGQVQMGQLAAATLRHGLVPQVVPEYTNFTVAGLMNGEGIQSSSFRYGCFTHTVTQVEVVLGSGDVVSCSMTENHELFVNIPESVGTLGIVTMANVCLRPAQPWVRSGFLHYSTLQEFVLNYGDCVTQHAWDFMEGLVLGPSSYLIIVSEFTAEPLELPVFHPSPEDLQRGEKYYYQHIRQDVVRNGKLRIVADAIPTAEFLFRSMRGNWWMQEALVNVPWLTNSKVVRQWLDMAARKRLQQCGFGRWGKMSRAEEERCFVLQDQVVRLSRLAEGIQFVQKRLGVYPLWICAANPEFGEWNSMCEIISKTCPRKLHCEVPVDIGIYGEPTVQPYHHHRALKELADFVDYSSVWGINYNMQPEAIREVLDPLRKRWKAHGVFPGLETKICAKRGSDGKAAEEEGPIFCWRLVEHFGHLWWLKLLLLLLLLVFSSVVLAVSIVS